MNWILSTTFLVWRHRTSIKFDGLYHFTSQQNVMRSAGNGFYASIHAGTVDISNKSGNMIASWCWSNENCQHLSCEKCFNQSCQSSPKVSPTSLTGQNNQELYGDMPKYQFTWISPTLVEDTTDIPIPDSQLSVPALNQTPLGWVQGLYSHQIAEKPWLTAAVWGFFSVLGIIS